MHGYIWHVTGVAMHAVINAQGPPVKQHHFKLRLTYAGPRAYKNFGTRSKI